jgi:serine/threonine protein kinase
MMITPEIPGLNCVALLHESAFQSTWKAVQTSLDRVVEVKLLHPQEDESAALATRHFLDIARTIASLKHPGIAQIYDVVTEAGKSYVIMEHVDGATLAEMVAGTGPLTPPAALRLMLPLAEALQLAWTQSHLVLRSLKPQNLRVNAQGQIKISDFSLAVQIQEGEDPTRFDGGHVVGTPHFIAPEQVLLRKDTDYRADMYALGATLYFLVTGKTPFEGLETLAILEQQVTGHIPHPRAVNQRLPGPLCVVIARLMMKKPADRYATWAEVAADLKALLSNRSLPHHRPVGGASTVMPLAGAIKEAPTGGKKYDRHRFTGRRSNAGADMLRMLLWMLLAIWFMLVTNQYLDYPLGQPPFRIPSLLSRRASPPRASRPPRVSSRPPVSSQQPRPNQPQDPVPVTAAVARPPETPAQTAQRFGDILPDELLRNMANALAKGDVAAARQALAQHPGGERLPEGQRLAAALDSLPNHLRLVEAGLLARRGTTITIRYLGRERKIVPRSVVQGELQAEFIADDGSTRPVSFKTDRLDPVECLRWLPPATNAGEHAVACILALQANDPGVLAQHIDASGPLSVLFNLVR